MNHDLRHSEDTELALTLANVADSISLRAFNKRNVQVRPKSDGSPVTDADITIERSLAQAIKSKYPADNVFGEEDGGHLREGRTWVLDPLDGTKNFVRGVGIWATLIALVVDGSPEVGVVSAPALGRRWWGAVGAGAWSSGAAERSPGLQRLEVSDTDRLQNAYVSTTRIATWARFHSESAYLRLASACWEDRGFGDFLQHCMVAEGNIDLAVEPIVNPWDVAPLRVIVEEAGGRCTNLDGTDLMSSDTVMSSNGKIHDDAVSLLAADRGTGQDSTMRGAS